MKFQILPIRLFGLDVFQVTVTDAKCVLVDRSVFLSRGLCLEWLRKFK